MPARLTTEQLHQTRLAVARHGGNVAAAARDLGLSPKSVRHRLQVASAGESPTGPDHAAMLDETLEQLEQARRARGLFVPEATRRPRPRVFARVILADTHGSHADSPAVAALLADMEHLAVREVVHLGDALECGGFLARHRTLGYVAQIDEQDPEEDIAATADLLDHVHRRCPEATIHYLEGNHEHRVERWCVDMAQGSRATAEYLMRRHAPEHVLHLEARGVRYYRQGERHCDLTERGALRLGRSYFTHGSLTRKHAAAGMVERFGGCVFYGHTHRADYFPTRMVGTGLVAAWCPGCLCNLQPRWRHNDPTTWTHGYIIQIVDDETGEFHAIPVPIYEGTSYLRNLLEAVT